MKLVIEQRPDRVGAVFRVDGHDQHVLESQYGVRCDEFHLVVGESKRIAAAIEIAWRESGLACGSGGVADQSFQQVLD